MPVPSFVRPLYGGGLITELRPAAAIDIMALQFTVRLGATLGVAVAALAAIIKL